MASVGEFKGTMRKGATVSRSKAGVACRIAPRAALVLILVASVLLRVAVALYLGDHLPVGRDDYSYSTLAARLASGHGYSFDRAWYPFTPADAPTAHWSFLYTAFLAAIYAVVGVHPLAARLVQALLGGILLPWMAYRLARRAIRRYPRRGVHGRTGGPSGVLERSNVRTLKRENMLSFDGSSAKPDGSLDTEELSPVPLLAAAIAAVYGHFILYAARPVTETFYIVALLWSLERALALSDRPTLGNGAVLGLSLGIAALLRQSILPWVPVLFAWLVWRAWWDARRSGWRWRWSVSMLERLNVGTLLVAGVVMVACIAPFTVRNYLVYDEFLLLNSNAGYAMYSAQHPMHGTSFQEYEAAPLPEDLRGRGLNEAQWDRALMRRGIEFVLDEPGRYLLLSLSRVRDMFEFWPTARSSLLYNVGRLTSFTLLLPFMVYGSGLAIRRHLAPTEEIETPSEARANVQTFERSHVERQPLLGSRLMAFSTTPTALLVLFMAFYSLLHILTWAMTRYRLPVDAVAIIFAAVAIDELIARVRALRARASDTAQALES